MNLYSRSSPCTMSLKSPYHVMNLVCSIPENINEGLIYVCRNNVLVLDKIVTACKNDDRVSKVFSIGSNHKNWSVFVFGSKSLQSR